MKTSLSDPEAQGGVKRPDGWDFHLARGDLQERVKRAVHSHEVLPPTLRAWIDAEGIVEVADRISNEVLASSGAIASERPHVRLMRVANALGARILFERALVSRREGLLSNHLARDRPARAILRRDPAGDWIIHVRDTERRLARESVAHELGHVLIYHCDVRGENSAWRGTAWSRAEETVANYIARLLLVPTSLVSDAISAYRNSAEAILYGLAGRFDVPLGLATLRWLDVCEHLPNGMRSVLLWRQYHPFDRLFLLAALRHMPNSSVLVSRLNDILAGLPWKLSFVQAVSFWQRLSGHRADTPELTLDSAGGIENAANAVRNLFAIHGAEPEGVAKALSDTRSPHYLRPEWILRTPASSQGFVPLRRGSAKAGSIAAQLAAESADALTGDEYLSIGSLKGTFQVHGVAHGSAELGKRFVLTANVRADSD